MNEKYVGEEGDKSVYLTTFVSLFGSRFRQSREEHSYEHTRKKYLQVNVPQTTAKLS